MAETLAEIVNQGLALETGCGYEDDVDLAMARGAFYRQHGWRLLAVATAAVEMRVAQMRCTADHVPDSDIDKFILAYERFDRLAFDAAVRGADEGGNDGR